MPFSDPKNTAAGAQAPRPIGAHARPAHLAGAPAGDEGGRPRRRAGLIALGVVGGLALAAYVGGAVAFANIYYPNTEIAGADVSLMPRATAVERIERAVSSYSLTVSGIDFTWTYTPSSAAEVVDAHARADEVLSANAPLMWPVRLAGALLAAPEAAAEEGAGSTAGSTSASAAAPQLPAAFDEQAFDESLTAAVAAFNEGRTGVFDGPSAFDEATGSFTFEKALANVKIDADKLDAAAKAALADLETSVTVDSSFFESFANGATTDQIRAACEAASKLIAPTVTLTMGGATVGTVGPKELAGWVVFGEDLTPTLDTESLDAWLKQLTIDAMDTVGTERSYTREDGKAVTISGGTWGWVADSAALGEQVREAVANGADATIEVPTSSAGDVFTAHGQRDWKAYIDVDLTEQHARYYDASGNLVWESGFISGNPNLGNETPTGIYRMRPCLRNITLVGKKDPATGEPIYRTPVSYWMPFIGGAIGFHDASWQAAANFSNPSAFYSVGSHGCINLPPEKAAELFNLVSEGLCVVVHT
ncbi:MAG: L,D-transpeptidase family protein [Collinsella sp.]|nr:L,D-transpeptidase family protein [Collinsella sp.]